MCESVCIFIVAYQSLLFCTTVTVTFLTENCMENRRWFYVFPISVYESFQDYIKVESLDGENKYDAGEHGLQVIITCIGHLKWLFCHSTMLLSPLIYYSLSFHCSSGKFIYIFSFSIQCDQFNWLWTLLHKMPYGLDYLSDTQLIYVSYINLIFFLDKLGSWEGCVFPKFPSCTSSSSASIYVWSNGWCLC